MTDRTEFLALIARWGLIPDDEPQVRGQDVRFTAKGAGEISERKILGYNDFVAEFSFDDNGKFVSLGVWE